ncbi:unnamed protein product [Bursaphelenchus xylophilus]|uniref:(pine wood nematode) hypothetical protein n=1 Tax=Bursaphelenchus xylophilus TaxID=6326 RepID=A0A1I7RHQ7_BURXY|nr:unnamed protein product [Bursaphelenchus xylophilus]CAG9115486.1 unnamed protein product [Bursaphelenchus xylophilus]
MSQSSDSEFDEPIGLDEEDFDLKEAEEDYVHGEFDGFPDESDSKNNSNQSAVHEWDTDVAEHQGDVNLDELHRLKELYKRQKEEKVDEEEEFLNSLGADNELQTLRNVTEVLREFEQTNELQKDEHEDIQPSEGRVRPQRFLAVLRRQVQNIELEGSDKELDQEGAGSDREEEVGDKDEYNEEKSSQELELDDSALDKDEDSQDKVEQEGEYDRDCEDSDKSEDKKSDQDYERQLAEALGGKTEIKRHVRISREVQRLMFSNPGAAIVDQFQYSRSTRAQRKASSNRPEDSTPASSPQKEKKLRPRAPKKSKEKEGYSYDSSGRLLYKGTIIGDQCDCIRPDCGGCFFPCPVCDSPRCGPICRSQRSSLIYCTALIEAPKEPQITRFNPLRNPRDLNI